jgi:hypothetical protein
MRCKYCFQAIPDHSPRCPQCGSQLAERLPAAESKPKGKGLLSSTPMTRQQTTTVAVVSILGVVCLLCVFISLAQPSLLPSPLIAALNLGTPLPTATFQATRSTIFTPTPLTWRDHTNTQAGFTMSFPAGWLVVNQARTGWQSTVRNQSDDYEWAETLFEVELTPAESRSRAVDPAAIDPDNGRVVVFTVGEAPLAADTTFAQIEEIARSQPATLGELAGTLVGTSTTAARSERLQVNGRDALLVEFTADPDLLGQTTRVRVRLYFIPIEDELFLVSYFAEEQLANQNRALYDQIVQGFEPTP